MGRIQGERITDVYKGILDPEGDSSPVSMRL